MSPHASPAAPATRAHDGIWAATDVPLRDWFAGQALVGLIPSPARPGVLPLSPSDLPRVAYRYADAMMQARSL